MEKGCDYIGKRCSTILSKIGSRSSGDSRCLWNALSDRYFYYTLYKLHVIFYVFHIFLFTDVSTEEEGNYTCYVNNVNMLQVKIIVISKARLLTQGEIKTVINYNYRSIRIENFILCNIFFFFSIEFLRHLGYLGFIFLLCSFCYCSGLVYTYRNRHKFEQTVPKEDIFKHEEELPLIG